MIYTAIFQNKAGEYTAIKAFSGPDRVAAWDEIQSKKAQTSTDTLTLLIPGSHLVYQKPRLIADATIDPFELNY
jgi:hypothetical protein